MAGGILVACGRYQILPVLNGLHLANARPVAYSASPRMGRTLPPSTARVGDTHERLIGRGQRVKGMGLRRSAVLLLGLKAQNNLALA